MFYFETKFKEKVQEVSKILKSLQKVQILNCLGFNNYWILLHKINFHKEWTYFHLWFLILVPSRISIISRLTTQRRFKIWFGDFFFLSALIFLQFTTSQIFINYINTVLIKIIFWVKFPYLIQNISQNKSVMEMKYDSSICELW